MGLIKWLKKELDYSSSNSSKRRQSEPPIPSRYHISLSPDVTQRDEAYVKALSKFNEWRHKQIFGSTSSKSAKKSQKKSSKRKKGKNNVDLNNTSLNYYEVVGHSEVGDKILSRKSCPAKANLLQSPGSLGGQTIYENEILEFESDFVIESPVHSPFRFDDVASPPGHFYKDSSNPFEDVISPNRRRQALPQDKSTYSPRIHENTTAIVCNTFEESLQQSHLYPSPHHQSLHQFHNHPSPHHLSLHHPSPHHQSLHQPTPPPHHLQEQDVKRKSRNPTYKTVKNKYGEEVEYALPFSQKSDEYSLEDSRDSNDNQVAFDTTKHFQEYVDENFRFLNEKSRLEASKSIVQVTDLDKTDGTVKTDDQQESVLQELNSLAMWSKTIGISKSSVEELNSTFDSVQKDLQASELLVCPRNSVVIDNGLSQVCINGVFYSGKFHNVPISQFVPNARAFSLESNVLRLNFDILRKVRHPDIVLLMGVSAENQGKLDALILEPLKGSLHHKIHYEKQILNFSEISSIISQVTKAATYLHEHGWVHSNICSHNIMFSRYQSNVVKLTSFELATSINSTEESKQIASKKLIDAFTSLNLEQIPYKLLPHFIEYRQQYSEENYLSPELFATDSKFVFPTKQSDVYGITLTLWEMLNGETPCAIFGQHPNLQEERCKEFKEILKLGLEINPNKRISNTLVLMELLTKIPIEPKKESSIVDCFTSLLSPKSHGDVIYDRTSTIKKKRNVNPERKISAKQLFISNQTKKTEEPKLINSTTKGDYQFDIGEITLPNTPIALSNKLRKAAWLSNKSLSPIVHVDSTEELNKSKKYKVNITIVQKSNDLDAVGNSTTISNQIKYWNTLGSSSSSTPTANNRNEEEKVDGNANVIPNSTGIQFNEIFLKNHLSSNNDFENSLWRKEKERCESRNFANNTVVFSPSRVSVKDAINKFESFSKSFNNTSNENENNPAICKIIKSKSFISKPLNRQHRRSISKSSSLEDINVSRLNLTLRNNVDENLNSKFTPSITPCSSNSELNLDKIVNSEKPLTVTLNFKNLERRASDVGTYFLHPQAMNNGKLNEVRHSIYGTEIMKRLNKAAGDQNLIGLKRTDSKKIKVGKLTCLNCGHKLFIVDDGDRGDGEGRPSEVFITPLKKGQVARSTEDLYIDDDFCEDLELGANMELGTRSELFDFIDFDILAAEIFSQSSNADIETILNSNI
ncbi:hypothetical protein ACFFRR_001804 [Megaselia abdita]